MAAPCSIDTAALDAAVARLRPLPRVVTEATAVIDSEGSYETLAGILEQDPALVARVLGVANSPFYGLSGRLTAVREACVVLGVHTLRSLILALGAVASFPAGGGRVYDWYVLWRHSFLTGACARVLAGNAGCCPDEAFTSGLLHDVGKFVLDECFSSALARAVEAADGTGEENCAAERAVLGLDHAEVGARLARHWQLPEVIAAAVAGHHEPARAGGHRALAVLVGAADVLAHLIAAGTTEPDDLAPLAARLGVPPEGLSALVPRLAAAGEQLVRCLPGA